MLIFFFIDNEELHQGNLKFVKKIITVSENPAIIEKYLYCPDQSVVFLGKRFSFTVPLSTQEYGWWMGKVELSGKPNDVTGGSLAMDKCHIKGGVGIFPSCFMLKTPGKSSGEMSHLA